MTGDMHGPSTRGSLIAKNRSHFPDLSREISPDLTDVPPAQRPLPPPLADHPVCPLCFAPLAAAHTAADSRPTRQHYQHNVLWSVPPVRRAVGNMVNTQRQAIVGTTVAPTVALCIHPIMVTSICQEASPLLLFTGGGDMRVAAAVLTMHSSFCTVVWCE